MLSPPTHNSVVVGSSPTRPTTKNLQFSFRMVAWVRLGIHSMVVAFSGSTIRQD